MFVTIRTTKQYVEKFWKTNNRKHLAAYEHSAVIAAYEHSADNLAWKPYSRYLSSCVVFAKLVLFRFYSSKC